MYKTILKIIAVLAAILLFLFCSYKIGQFIFGGSSGMNLSQSSVVKEIRELGRLETSSFTMEKIIEGGQKGNFFSNILYGDRILLIAHAEIIAGFDLKKLADKDVEVDDGKLTISLPAPEILVTKLDNEKTRVYDRKQGILSRDGKDLESKARAEAERAIRQDACAANILETASDNARKQLKALFATAGFDEVTVYIPQALCQ
ncbi:MAG TPA: DUF4230 domain-containing protein [Candidatus Paceibacterota bacterium]